MSDQEIEIKVKVASNKPLLVFLQQNAEFQSEEKQVDEYFSPLKNSFTEADPIKEWLRLREEGGKYSLNYKNWHYDDNGKSYHCDEFETEIKNPEQGRKILKALGFVPLVKVDKTRKNYLYNKYQISLDSVKDLGDFVEIEYAGSEKGLDPKKITADMVEFLKKLGCEKIARYYAGYPFQLLFPGKAPIEEY